MVMEVACPENIMVDLSGYVIIIVETKDKKIRLYGELITTFNTLVLRNYLDIQCLLE